ncbi:hypothetical protein RHS03_09025, partial [Rhizoctonia solani]
MVSLRLAAGPDLALTSQPTSTTVLIVPSRTSSPSLTTSVSALTSIDSGSSLSTTPTSTTQFTPTQNLTDPTNTTSQTISSATPWASSGLSRSLTPSPNLGTAPTSSLSSSSTHGSTTNQHHGVSAATDTTSLAAVSSHELPLTSHSSQSITVTTTNDPVPTATAAPGTTENYNHRLIINLGDCAGFTTPRLSLIAGEMSDLVPIGDGRFEIGLKADPQNSVFGLIVSLRDEGVRCGSEDYASCTAIDIGFGATSELIMNVLMAGDYSKDMYPFSIWLEDGTVWNAQPASSPEAMYNCWGWTDAECPYAIKHGGTSGASWTLSSNNISGDMYIGFCPSNGPAWSSIPPNPEPDAHEWGNESTYVVLPSQMAIPTSTFIKPIGPTALSVPAPTTVPLCDQPSDCVTFSTYIVQEGTSTIRSTFVTPAPDTTRYEGTKVIIDATTAIPETTIITTGGLSAINPSTAIVLNSTTTSRKTTFLTTPTPVTISSTVQTTSPQSSSFQSEWPSSPTRTRIRDPTETSSTESRTAISTLAPTLVPTYSYITDGLGSTISTSSYDLTVSATPTTTLAPTEFIISSWTTWMTINGSTVPAIAGEVGVLTTVSMTYLLESGSIIPVSELSTRSVRSSQTSDPSPTLAVSAENDQTKQNQGGKIAGAVVGTLVGLVLGSLVVWYVCYRRRRRQMRDNFARGDPSWVAPRHEAGSGGGSRLLVDLDEGPRMSSSYIQPWVPPRPVVPPPRKGGQLEMESAPGAYGVSVLSSSSREPELLSNEGGSSSRGSTDQHQVSTATATRIGKPSTRSESTLQPNAMVSQRPVSSSHLSTSLASLSMSLLPTPFQDEPPRERTPTSPPIRAAPIPGQEAPLTRAEPSRRRQLHDEEQGRHDAIPPLYNEAWNTAR